MFIKTVNTDVLIIAIALTLHLELKEIWIGSGNGLHRINIPIHAIYQQLGHDRSTGFTFSYAFTEGDQVSVFVKSKNKTLWIT